MDGVEFALDGGNLQERTDSQGQTMSSLSNNTLIGSLQSNGSSGGPWVVNLGQPPVLTNINFGSAADHNIIVGVTSWGYNDASVKEQGASPFTTGNITKPCECRMQLSLPLALANLPLALLTRKSHTDGKPSVWFRFTCHSRWQARTIQAHVRRSEIMQKMIFAYGSIWNLSESTSQHGVYLCIKLYQIMLRLLGLVATTQAMLQPAAGQTGGETTSSPNQTSETIDYAHAKPMPLPSANTKPPLDERAGPTQRERFGPAGSSPGNPGNGTGGPGPQH